jgi:hypothetical protein
MPEDPSQFQSENLPKFRWEAFFDELLETYKGKPVAIFTDTDFLSSEAPADNTQLSDIDYDSSYSGLLIQKGRLVVTSKGAQGESVAIDEPTLVWVYRDLEGDPAGIEVIDEENNRIALRFA